LDITRIFFFDRPAADGKPLIAPC